MKKQLLIIFVGVFVLLGCQSDETANVSQVVKATYPTIKLKGGDYYSLSVGSSFSDPGATLTDDLTGQSKDIEAISNNIDPSKPGLYFAVYRASNKNGFETTAQRAVAVTTVSASVDLSGLYKRTTNQGPVNVTKLATGLYLVDNVGAVPPPSAAIFPVLMVQLSSTEISIPEQFVPGAGDIDCTNEKILFDSNGKVTGLSWAVINPGFGTAVRTFIKQ